jgi:hypothetical protein
MGGSFPSADDFHDAVEPERNARFLGDEFNGIDVFPFGSLAVNRIPLCDSLVSLASALLQEPDLRLYSAEARAKYEGAADYEQVLHRDYLTHTVLVPSSAPGFLQVELFVFLSEVTTELGAPRMAARSRGTDDLRARPRSPVVRVRRAGESRAA